MVYLFQVWCKEAPFIIISWAWLVLIILGVLAYLISIQLLLTDFA